MLPDLPNLKGDLQAILDRYLYVQANARLGVFSESPRRMIREGNRLRVLRADGSSDESRLVQTGAEIRIETADVPSLGIEQRRRKLDEMAEQLAAQMSRYFFQSLGDTLDQAGQSINNQGKPLDAEAILAMLEKMEMEFDANGRPNLKMVIPPALLPRIRALEEQYNSDPELRRRHDEILDKKRRNWRAREASRKLVG